ncbi:MAG TPA: LuxR C-terminal-related transcriptional regulator [Roseiflexaceae bacterium]|nr:LuxR C-terminal-related transcriptional regulator [Roseiflexaceae bacterium]
MESLHGLATPSRSPLFEIVAGALASAGLEQSPYRLLIEQIPVITYIAGPNAPKDLLYVSPQVEPLLGFTPGEWIADPALRLHHIHPDDWEVAIAVLSWCARQGAGACEYRMLTRDGRTLWLREEVCWLRSCDGMPRGCCGMLRDISACKQTEAELTLLRDRLAAQQRTLLTGRERAVLRLVRQGQTDKAIGAALALSERTVRYCLAAICSKLGVQRRAEAVCEAERLRLLDE